jgi:hypothetical protein
MLEVEIGRITVPASLGKTVCGTPSQWKKLGIVAYACHPAMAGNKIGRS